MLGPMERAILLSSDLSSFLRERCASLLARLVPGAASDCLGDWNLDDVLELKTIFQVARVSREAELPNSLLQKNTILRVLEKLTTASFFNDHGAEGLVDLEQHLRLLAGALRLYKYEQVSLNHDLRAKLFKGIKSLAAAFEANRRKCPSEKQVENWNVAFLIQYCQALLGSIKDSDSLFTGIAKRTMITVDGALSGYGGQWVDTKRCIRDVTRFERSLPAWHAEFVRLEDLCFSLFARRYTPENTTNASGKVEKNPQSELRDIALSLCDALENMLVDDPGKFYSLLGAFEKGFGKATQLLFDCGVYEENAEYSQFGIIDLMHQMTFCVGPRESYLKEFVRVIRLVLERSHPKANSIQRKAIDLYRRIQNLEKETETHYGGEADSRAIQKWIRNHKKDIEPLEAASRYISIQVSC
jgi:hypothetical protein